MYKYQKQQRMCHAWYDQHVIFFARKVSYISYLKNWFDHKEAILTRISWLAEHGRDHLSVSFVANTQKWLTISLYDVHMQIMYWTYSGKICHGLGFLLCIVTSGSTRVNYTR